MTSGILALYCLCGYILWRLLIATPNRRARQKQLCRLISAENTSEIKETDPAEMPRTTVPTVAKTPEEDFIVTAKEMFLKIATAFAESDKKTLQDLLSPYVYERYCEAIDKRDGDKLKVDFQLANFEKVEIMRQTYRLNEVRVHFVTLQLNCLKNEKEEIVEGAFDKLRVVSDVWEFERRPDVVRGWKVCATQSESLL